MHYLLSDGSYIRGGLQRIMSEKRPMIFYVKITDA